MIQLFFKNHYCVKLLSTLTHKGCSLLRVLQCGPVDLLVVLRLLRRDERLVIYQVLRLRRPRLEAAEDQAEGGEFFDGGVDQPYPRFELHHVLREAAADVPVGPWQQMAHKPAFAMAALVHSAVAAEQAVPVVALAPSRHVAQVQALLVVLLVSFHVLLNIDDDAAGDL